MRSVKNGVAGDFLNGTDGCDINLVHFHNRNNVKVVGTKDRTKARHNAGIRFELGDLIVCSLLFMRPDVCSFLKVMRSK